MSWQLTPYSIPLFIGALLLIFISILLSRDTRSAIKYLIAANISISIYLIGYGMELGETVVSGAVFWSKIEYLGTTTIPAFLLMLSIAYTGRGKWLSDLNKILLLIIPISTIILAWTNETHQLIWKDISMIPSGPIYVFEFSAGPWYWVNIAYLFMSAITGMSLLILSYRNSEGFFRKQISILIVGYMLPIIAQVGYTSFMLSDIPILKINWQAYAFALTGLIISIGIRNLKLFNILPVGYNAIFESIEDLIIVLDAKNRVVNFNSAAAEYLQWDRSTAIGEPLRDLVSPDQLAFIRRYADKKAVRETVTFNERVFDMKISEITQQESTSPGLLVVFRDITERVRTEQELNKHETRYQKLVEQAGDIVFLTNELGFFEYVNPKVEVLTGYARDEIIGLLFTELIHPDWQAETQRYYLDQRDNEIPESTLEFPIVTKQGEEKWVEQVVTLLFNKGEVTGMQGVVRDVTKRIQAEKALRENEQRYRALFENTIDAVLLADLDLKYFAVNQQAADLLGYTIEEFIGMPSSNILERAESEESKQKLEQLYEHGILPVYERTLIRKDGEPIRTELSVALIKDDDGKPLYIQSVARDIRERVQTRAQLRLQATALEATANGIVITDKDGEILWVNPGFSNLTGYTFDEAVGENPRILKSGLLPDGNYVEMWETILSGKVWRGQVINRRKDKSLYHEEMTITPVLDDNGAINRFIAIKQDVSLRVEAEEELRHIATHDPVTGLPNRILLYDRLDRAIERTKRSDGKFSVIFLDLDNFKLVNDHAGHEKGDWILKTIAEQLSSSLRASDTISRWGGDEFVIILENDNNLDQILARVMEAASYRLKVEKKVIGITPSIGIARYPDHGINAETLLKRADIAMYAAKESGKNQYAIYSDN
jgi:diguanylate cyclase (GGDEF)-like protein/PAS domain S-box-containing protein